MASLLDAKIALFHQDATTKEDALKLLSDEFVKSGVAKDTFYEGLLTREKSFPTGLSANKICVAIPHTDVIHVNKTQIGFMSLNNPVDFIEMGTDDKHIGVTMMFMLALKEAHQQLEMLQKLMDVFQNDDLLDRFASVDNYDDFYKLCVEAGLDLD